MAASRTAVLSPEVQRQLDIAIERLLAEYNPERIYLYGSQARGDATVDSDIDVLVLMPDGFKLTLQEMFHSRAVLGSAASNVELKFGTLSRFLSRAPYRATFSGTVLREGELLYERA
jgi:predicted nucleotidyltransferase